MIAVYTLLGSGCVDVTQEFWVNGDGSGKVHIDASISEAVLQSLSQLSQSNESLLRDSAEEIQKMKAELMARPGVRSADVRVTSESEYRHILLDLELADLNQATDVLRNTAFIRRTATSNPASDGLGVSGTELKFAKLPNGHQGFTGSIDLRPTSNSTDDSLSRTIRAASVPLFAGKFYTVKIHGASIVSANGTINHDQNFVEWKIPMMVFLNPPFHQEMSAEIDANPNPPVIALAAGGLALGLTLVAGSIWKRRKAAVSAENQSAPSIVV